MPAVKKETIIGKNGYIDQLLEYVVTKAILKEEEYDENLIIDFFDKIREETGDDFIIARIAKRMEQKNYPPSYVAGVIDILAKAREVKISKEVALIQNISKSIAQEISKVNLNVSQLAWVSPEIIDLSKPRPVPELIGSYDEEPDCIVYLRGSTGIGTVYLDSSTTHPWPMGTRFREIRHHPFRDLYIENEEQENRYMYLLVGKGDVTIEEPVRMQGQYRPVIASSTALLVAGATYTSPWVSVIDCGHLSYLTNADVPAAANGVRLQESNDGVTPHYEQRQSTTLITIGGVNSYYARLDSIPRSKYVRMVYVNAGVAQGSFSLLCLGREL